MVSKAPKTTPVEDFNDYDDSEDTNFLDKASLLGVPFVITSAEQKPGQWGDYWHVNITTEDGREGSFIDRSTGVSRQLDGVFAKRGNLAGLHCRYGLRVSNYNRTVDGKNIEAHTYYVATK